MTLLSRVLLEPIVSFWMWDLRVGLEEEGVQEDQVRLTIFDQETRKTHLRHHLYVEFLKGVSLPKVSGCC